MHHQDFNCCPACRAAVADTVAGAPFISWYYRLSPSLQSRRLLGCRSCVRGQLAAEAINNLVAAWHSLVALAGNLFCVFWNASKMLRVAPRPEKVEALLADVGLASAPADLPRVAASLAAVIVTADGRVQQDEIDTALELGQQWIEGFVPEQFIEALENAHLLPTATALASMLAHSLDQSSKDKVLGYLTAIAAADREIHDSEVEVLRATAAAMGGKLRSSEES